MTTDLAMMKKTHERWRWVELGGGGRSWVELGGGGWGWVEVGGGGRSWVEVGGTGWSWAELGGAGWSWVAQWLADEQLTETGTVCDSVWRRALAEPSADVSWKSGDLCLTLWSG